MLKTRADFNSEDEYKTYVKTSEFLVNYNWEGKTKEEIIYDMAMPEYEIRHLDQAMELLECEGNYQAIDLDRLIMYLHEGEMMEKENVV